MTVLIGDDPALPESLTAEEEAAMESYEGMVYRLSVALMRLDGNDGDPHHLIWEGGPVPEPWGDVWQRYEPQALSVIDSIGEASARAMVDALTKAPMPVDRIAMLWNSLPLETDAQSVVTFVRAVEDFHGIPRESEDEQTRRAAQGRGA